jgi:hypothetical protein
MEFNIFLLCFMFIWPFIIIIVFDVVGGLLSNILSPSVPSLLYITIVQSERMNGWVGGGE